MTSRTLLARDLGMESYLPVWRRMSAFTNHRDSKTDDEIWLVEHPAVFTLGQAGRREHVLSPGDIPVLSCDRGGQVTYHGPGQLVAYPLLDLQRLRIGVRALVELMEETIIQTLASFDVVAQRKPGAPGVYVGEAKIAALGLRIRRGCSFHGVSLNVAMNLEPFQRINPCGYAGLQVTQMRALMPDGTTPSVTDLAPKLVDIFSGLLGSRACWASPGEIQTEPPRSQTDRTSQVQLK
ncbi:MAG: lipoyl(octanoyl) transferase LipB [Cellvibrionaceae bacterium]